MTAGRTWWWFVAATASGFVAELVRLVGDDRPARWLGSLIVLVAIDSAYLLGRRGARGDAPAAGEQEMVQPCAPR